MSERLDLLACEDTDDGLQAELQSIAGRIGSHLREYRRQLGDTPTVFDASSTDIDPDLIAAGLSWNDVARVATQSRRELEATRRELDRVNAELTRLRRELLDLTDLSRSK